MNLFAFLRSALSESDGTGSNNRLMLFLMVCVILALIVAITILRGLYLNVWALPEIPASLETLIEFLALTFVGGSAVGKGVNAFKAVKGAADAVATPTP